MIFGFVPFNNHILFPGVYPNRAMVVLHPLKVTITNFPADHCGSVTVPNFPADEKKGTHTVPFQQVIYIEKEDFNEV